MSSERVDELRERLRNMEEGKRRIEILRSAYVASYNTARSYETEASEKLDGVEDHLKIYFFGASAGFGSVASGPGDRVLPGYKYIITESKRVVGNFGIGMDATRHDLGLEPAEHGLVLFGAGESIAVWRDKDRWFAGVDGSHFDLSDPDSHNKIGERLFDVFKTQVERLAESTPHS